MGTEMAVGFLPTTAVIVKELQGKRNCFWEVWCLLLPNQDVKNNGDVGDQQSRVIREVLSQTRDIPLSGSSRLM